MIKKDKICSIKWRNLPFFSIKRFECLLNIPDGIAGIYFIASDSKGLLYIGITRSNLRLRLTRNLSSFRLGMKGHKCLLPMLFLQDCKIHYLASKDPDFISINEKKLIYHFSPPLNEKHINKNFFINQPNLDEMWEFLDLLEEYDCRDIKEATLVLNGEFEYIKPRDNGDFKTPRTMCHEYQDELFKKVVDMI